MLHTATIGVLAAAAVFQQTDTTVSVEDASRLELHSMGGEVVIRTWDRPEMHIVAEHSSRDVIAIDASGSLVKVRATRHMGVAQSVDYRITIPGTMSVELGGLNLSADLQGVRGSVEVETVNGDVALVGGTRFVSLHSVQGRIVAREVEGELQVNAVNGGVEIEDVAGPVTVVSVNGPITLRRVASSSVEAQAVNGEISYEGTIRDDGRYRLTTHAGSVTMGMPEGTNATVSVSTFSGEFDTAFPVTLTGVQRGAKRFSFVLGDGSARVELDSFSGSIRLRRSP